MTEINAIKQLFSDKKNEEIYLSYSREEVEKALGFKDALRLAYCLLYDRKWEEEMQLYSIKLILAVKDQFPEEWDKDWRYEAFLGSAYNVVLGDDRNFDERYYAYRRAYKKASNDKKSPLP